LKGFDEQEVSINAFELRVDRENILRATSLYFFFFFAFFFANHVTSIY